MVTSWLPAAPPSSFLSIPVRGRSLWPLLSSAPCPCAGVPLPLSPRVPQCRLLLTPQCGEAPPPHPGSLLGYGWAGTTELGSFEPREGRGSVFTSSSASAPAGLLGDPAPSTLPAPPPRGARLTEEALPFRSVTWGPLCAHHRRGQLATRCDPGSSLETMPRKGTGKAPAPAVPGLRPPAPCPAEGGPSGRKWLRKVGVPPAPGSAQTFPEGRPAPAGVPASRSRRFPPTPRTRSRFRFLPLPLSPLHLPPRPAR